MTEAGAKIKKTVEETVKYISFSFSFVNPFLTGFVSQSLLTEFNKEQDAFIKSKNKAGEALPPWVGYPDEEALKEEILSLSTVSLLMFKGWKLLF